MTTRTALTVASLVMSMIAAVDAATLRVPWDYPTIQVAVDAAVDGDVIEVYPGVYREALDLRFRNLKLVSHGGPNVTVIRPVGTSGGSMIEIGPGEVRGFTFTGANFDGNQTAIKLFSGGTQIRDNVFAGNSGTSTAIFGSGSPVIEGNVFEGNICPSTGQLAGVVVLFNPSGPILLNNVFRNNECRALNWAVLSNGSAPLVINNSFLNNREAIYFKGQVMQAFRNNLIAMNDVGLTVVNTAQPVWEHNLLWNNGVDYQGLPDQTGINGNLVADPLLADVVNGDIHLTADSPAIDTGSPDQAPAQDFDGGMRPQDGDGDGDPAVDIGADEFGAGFGPYPDGATLFVDASNPSAGSGFSNDPFNSIQAALNASLPGDVVGIAPGDYAGVAVMQNGVDLVGADAQTTILDGGGQSATVICADARLEGLRIRNASFANVDCTNGAAPVIIGNIIEASGGEAIWLSASAATILDNDITADPDFGGGCPCDAIRGINAMPLIQGNRIDANDPNGNISAIDFDHSGLAMPSFTIRDNEIVGSIRVSGAPEDGNDDEVIINNLIVSGNGFSSAINIAHSDVGSITNNTIIGGSGIRVQGGSGTANILNNNLYDADIDDCGANTGTIANNNMFPSIANRGCSAVIIGENGNISVDPEFIDTAGGDYRLAPGSPLIDAGDSSAPGLPETDLDGNARIIGPAIDIGAYEAPLPDSDGDGVPDDSDNCTERVNPAQRDTDGDGIGNVCDADTNGSDGVQDCLVNFLDLLIYRQNFFQMGDLDTDNNGDNITNFLDLLLVREQFFGPPGPSADGCN